MATLISKWHLNDNLDTTNVVDSEGANNGTFNDAGGNPNTSAHHVVGHIGTGALDFDGSDDYVTLTNPLNASAGTISFWINPDTQAENKHIICDINGYIAIRYLTANNLNFIINDGVAKNTSSQTITTGVWTHIVATWDSSNIKLYVNASQVGSDVAAGALGGTASNLQVGGKTTVKYDGKIDEVRVYNGALEQWEIDFLYNNGNGTENEISSSSSLDLFWNSFASSEMKVLILVKSILPFVIFSTLIKLIPAS